MAEDDLGIVTLTVSILLTGAYHVTADYRTVYRGRSKDTVQRWLDYWRDQMPWSEIKRREEEA